MFATSVYEVLEEKGVEELGVTAKFEILHSEIPRAIYLDIV